MRATLRRVKDELRRRMHRPIPEQGRWLGQVLTGFFACHAVPTNSRALRAFHCCDAPLAPLPLTAQPEGPRHLGSVLAVCRCLAPATAHSAPLARPTLRRSPPKVGAECLNWARSDLCGGCPVTGIPTANRSPSPPALERITEISELPVKAISSA
jgi:hypothetical protein